MTRLRRSPSSIVTPWDFAGGVDLTGTNYSANADAIENAMQAAVDDNKPFCFHDGVHAGSLFKVDRQIVVSGDVIRIDGAGGATHAVGTRIEWQAGSASWGLRLESAAGASGNGSCPSGYCRNLTITKAGSYSQDGTIGFQLRGLRQFVVDSVTSQGWDVAFDMIDNCFGTVWINCRAPEATGFVGMNIRTGTQSGNDILFLNCWFAGKNAAVHISGGAGNFRFFGGQFLGGNGYTTDQDGLGVITWGKDYLTGTTGNCGVIEIAGDFENSKRMWWLRGYGTVQLHVHDSAFLATEATQVMIGFSKMENLNDSKILYHNNTMRGTYSGAAMVTESGANSGFGITELNWLSTTPSTVNSVSQSAGWFKSTRHWTGAARGFAVEHSGSLAQIRLNGAILESGHRATIDGFFQDNVAASQTAVVLNRWTSGGTGFPTKWIAPRAGSITGVCVKSNAARTNGTLTVEVYKNGSATGLTAVLDGTNTTFKATTQIVGTDTFVAGDELDVRITTSGTWTPTTADVACTVEVET